MVGGATLDLGGPRILAGAKLEARVVAVLRTDGAASFVSKACDLLPLELDGIPGDRHRGFTRAAGGREPWYRRGTTIRSGRQLSVLSVEEMAAVGAAMGLPRIEPGWIGGNIVVEGVGQLSYLPPGTRLFFEGDASIVVEQMNGPCRFAGAAIAEHYPNRDDIALGFVRDAKRRRGIVASVERAGTVRSGSRVSVSIPEQWIYGVG